MLYDDQVPKVCAHCIHARDFNRRHELCHKRGPVSPDYSCAHFKYDPLRRVPPKPVRMLKPPSKEAFEL